MDSQTQTINTYDKFWNTDPSTDVDLDVYHSWNLRYWDHPDFRGIIESIDSTKPLSLAEFGCGRGLALKSFVNWIHNCNSNIRLGDIYGIDGWDIRESLKQSFPGAIPIQALLHQELPSGLKSSLDIGFSVGVLHHIDDVESAVRFFSTAIKPGGLFFLHCNNKFPMLRQATDDSLRKYLHSQPYGFLQKFCEDITKLSESFSRLPDVAVPSLHSLGIPEGEYHPHVLLNYYICKMYYNSSLTFERNVHANVDWYEPEIVKGLDEEYIASAFARHSLRVVHSFSPTPSSIALVFRKPA